jgi:hypothetical protein
MSGQYRVPEALTNQYAPLTFPPRVVSVHNVRDSAIEHGRKVPMFGFSRPVFMKSCFIH